MSAQVTAPIYRHRSRPTRQGSPRGPESESVPSQSVASSSRLPAVPNGTNRQSNGLVSPSHSTTSLSLRNSTISPTPSAETFDAFVQAADPRHPDHTAWLERYSSFSSRPSRQSSTQTRSSIDRRRRTPTSTQLRQADENGSDADDPLDDDKGWAEQETYFKQGSIRSHHSSSTVSTQQRRRARSNRDKTKPKPLQPPTPPPRISSSVNWQSAYGSPSIPESHEVGAPPSYGHVSPAVNGTSHSAPTNEVTVALDQPHAYTSGVSTTGLNDASLPLSSLPSSRDNMIAVSQPDEKRFFKLPRALFGSRRPSGPENDQIVPSPLSTQSFASQRISYDQGSTAPRKSFSRIRQVLGADVSKPLPVKPEDAAVPRKSTSQNRQTSQDRIAQPVIATQRSSKSIPRVPPPTMSQLELVENRRSVDAGQTLDLEAFPLRLDDEFRENENEFEMSEDEPDDGLEPEEIRLPWVSTSFTPHVPMATRPPVRTTVRSPGVVRRSLDSIVSPFRAGMLAQSSAQGAANRDRRPNGNAAQQEAPSRRSMSESRFVRPFLPRPRQGSVAGQIRPLSVVTDQPDAEIGDAPSPSTLPTSQSVPANVYPPSANLARPDQIDEEPSLQEQRMSVDTRRPSLWKRSQRASMETTRAGSTGRSLQNSFSRSSTQVNQVKAFTEPTPPLPDLPNSQSRRKLSSFLSKMRRSSSSSKLPAAPSRESTQATVNTDLLATPASAGRMSLDAQPPRSRSRSFASRGRAPSFPRQEDQIPAIPEYPTSTSAERLGESDEPWRRQLLTSAVSMSLNGAHSTPPAAAGNSVRRPSEAESDQLHGSSLPAKASRSSQSLGRLWRRRPTREDIEVVPQAVNPAPTVATVDNATPRSSMSSARGFDVTPTDDVASPNGPVRLTIRKTLSPAIINEKPQPVNGDSTFSTMRRSRSEPFAASSDQEELDELDDDEHAFRSPLGRFIRGNMANDRLSRVEETGERQPQAGDGPGLQVLRATSSPRTSPFGEHSMRRSLSGDVRNRAAPTAFDETETFSRLRNYSLDVSRRPIVTTPEPVSALSAPTEEGSPAADGQPFKSSSAGHSSGYVAPASTAFLSRSGRSSFSQDRDRTPVASPISVPLTNNRGGVGQALQMLRGKSKSKGALSKGKGVGPPDVVVLGLPEDEDDQLDIVPPDAMRRPSVGTSASHTFAASSASHKRPDNAVLPPSPTSAPDSKSTAPAPNHSAGLGLGSLDFQDGATAQNRIDGGEGSLMTSTTSEGTFSTLGAQTPESSYSQAHHVAHLQPVGAANLQPDLRAFDAMLGSFPQQEKVLLRDISARAMEHRKTPMTSNDDLNSISTKQPDHVRSDFLHVDTQNRDTSGTSSIASAASLD